MKNKFISVIFREIVLNVRPSAYGRDTPSFPVELIQEGPSFLLQKQKEPIVYIIKLLFKSCEMIALHFSDMVKSQIRDKRRDSSLSRR